jgi:hypothetical protein
MQSFRTRMWLWASSARSRRRNEPAVAESGERDG